TAGIVLPLVLIIQKYFLHSDVPYQLLILSIVLCVLIFVTHRSNIKRLINGQENKFGRSEKS
ncbi:acyl-phosphate glycerol 3-phosphate acyltransferase, partial [candidate division KSB1 bacterium]